MQVPVIFLYESIPRNDGDVYLGCMGKLSVPCSSDGTMSCILQVSHTSRNLRNFARAEVVMWLTKGMLVGARLLEASCIVDNCSMKMVKDLCYV
jgi:hypothetical protein